MRIVTPIGAFVRGLLAGAAGSAVQNVFFRVTQKRAPRPSPDAFHPPEPLQREELPAATVARRLVEDLAKRGPLDEARKARGATLVHYGFGSAWGGLYGLLRESTPLTRGPLGVAAFSSMVWLVSDNLILPAFRLGGWMRAYSPAVHLYAWLAHIAYGAAVAATYALMRPRPVAVALAAAWALGARQRLRRLPVPRRARPGARKAIAGLAVLRARQRSMRQTLDALRAP